MYAEPDDHFFPFFFFPESFSFSPPLRFPPVPDSSLTLPFVSFGFTLKNPSNRPCCLAVIILLSLAAPARILSSL